MEGRGSVQLCGRVALFELNNIFGFEKVFGEPYPPLILEGAGYQVLKIARLSGIIGRQKISRLLPPLPPSLSTIERTILVNYCCLLVLPFNPPRQSHSNHHHHHHFPSPRPVSIRSILIFLKKKSFGYSGYISNTTWQKRWTKNCSSSSKTLNPLVRVPVAPATLPHPNDRATHTVVPSRNCTNRSV